MSGFVIVYNRKSHISDVKEFSGPEGFRAAFDERLRLEALNADPDVEIVSLVGKSLKAIQQTHSRYFAAVAN